MFAVGNYLPTFPILFSIPDSRSKRVKEKIENALINGDTRGMCASRIMISLHKRCGLNIQKSIKTGATFDQHSDLIILQLNEGPIHVECPQMKRLVVRSYGCAN